MPSVLFSAVLRATKVRAAERRGILADIGGDEQILRRRAGLQAGRARVEIIEQARVALLDIAEPDARRDEGERRVCARCSGHWPGPEKPG